MVMQKAHLLGFLAVTMVIQAKAGYQLGRLGEEKPGAPRSEL